MVETRRNIPWGLALLVEWSYNLAQANEVPKDPRIKKVNAYKFGIRSWIILFENSFD